MIRFLLLVICMMGAGQTQAMAAESPSNEEIRGAVSLAIPLLEKGAAGSADKRKCFTCHNQTMPVLALSAAKSRGFAINLKNYERQIQHTVDHLKRGRKNYLLGKGQGGRVITAGYALRTLEAGKHEPDDTTAAVTSYLLQYQKENDHWRQPGSRPPSSGSDFTTTYLALRGLDRFGAEHQRDKIEARRKVVRRWLLNAQPNDTEDRVFRIRALAYAAAGDKAIQREVKDLVTGQRDDGGWAQAEGMASDAYATGSALAALLESGGLDRKAPVIERGVAFLLKTQLEDGSWRVKTRAKPIQDYFETGFPHQKDQFISIAASGWATLALVLSLPE